ncbi:hypothetical protein GGR52DRAFT_577512 [Hypoxylon sp. FL1284]|nr:hypothetical protein GGR52DRAFT_577512 [Hypoxylon sp. FL1284]
MSHITTTSHGGRKGFNALPQTHTPDGDLRDYENRHDNDDNPRREHEQQRYDEGRYDSQTEVNFEDTALPDYSKGRPWSRATSDYSQISTSYKPNMIVSNEAVTELPPVMDRERPNYKPSALRWPFLFSLLAVILAFVGLMAWALHVLPVLNSDIDILPDGLRAREEMGFSSSIGVLDVEPVEAVHKPVAVVARTENSSDTKPTIFLTPVGEDFGHVGDQTVSGPESPSKPTPLPTTTTATGEDADPTPYYSKPEGDFGAVGGQVTISESEPMPSMVPTKPQSDYGNVGSKTASESTEDPETSLALPGNYGSAGSVTVSETSFTETPNLVTAELTVVTSSEGVAMTSTIVTALASTPHTTTLTDSQGQATATHAVEAFITTTQTDSLGAPTATATLYPADPSKLDGNGDSQGSEDHNSNNGVVTKTYFISYGEYVVGMFLPTILAIILAIPIRILDLNAKILQPWHVLTHDRGTVGRESLCLETSGWQSIIAGFRSLAAGQPMVFLTSVLVLASALLIPLSAEAIAFDLRGIGCVKGSGSAQNCAYVLSVFNQAAGATIALLGIMGLAVFAILFILLRWQSGVSTNPWSMCGIASLTMNPDVRRLFTSLPAGVDVAKMPKGLLQSILEDRWFKLGYFYGPNGTIEYGIMLHDGNADGYASGQVGDDVKEPQDHHAAPTKPSHHLPFLMLGYAGRSVFLFVLCGLLALILYYNNTGGDTAFENFMDSESFGVRFLFTSVGVIISFFWASFFSSIAVLSPYQLLAKSPQHARRSILLAPPTNAFSGLWSSIRRRHSFLAVVAVTSILSEFLTIFLGNIPFRITQTFLIHSVCTWSAVGILCIMILVVMGSFFVTWPHMPVDPSTVAGAMYYVCDSWMLGRFEGLSTMTRNDRDWRVNEMKLKYEFGEIRSASGITRVGVDASSSSGSGEWVL